MALSTSRVAEMTSGPMPSPGNTAMWKQGMIGKEKATRPYINWALGCPNRCRVSRRDQTCWNSRLQLNITIQNRLGFYDTVLDDHRTSWGVSVADALERSETIRTQKV